MKSHDDAFFGDELSPDHEYAPLQRVMTRLREHAIARPAPVPSATLAQRMNLGLVGEQRRDAPALVLPITGRPRVVAPRVRYAIAAAVSALLLAVGLAGAGALPSALQDPISHTLDQIGLQLPGSDTSSSPSSSPRSGASAAHGKGPAGGGGAAGGEAVRGGSETGPGDQPGGSSKAGTGSTTSTTLATSVTVPPVTAPDGRVILAPITVELPGLPPLTVPGVTPPPVTLPPLALPPITLPPITLPAITLPPITLPLLTLPPIFP